MPKRKSEAVPNPSKETLSLLESVRGITDVNAPQVAQTAGRLLTLPEEQQVAAAIWMGSQPDYAAMLTYLVSRASVTGALRRAVKQALFEMRRRGVQVAVAAEEKPPRQESVGISRAWAVEECFASAPYAPPDAIFALHLRFFMRHVSGQRAVFQLNAGLGGHLYSARMAEEGVSDLYEECIRNPYRASNQQEAGIPANEFVTVPVEWAVRIAHELRQRNLKDHVAMPTHAAFYWGRLPEPPEHPVPHPIDSISDVEAGWFVTSLLPSEPPVPLPFRVVQLLVPYTPAPDELARQWDLLFKETETRIVLSPQSEEERKRQMVETLHQRLFPDERMREILLFIMPIFGSLTLLGGDRDAALWFKALWRELKERTDRPFWRTETASILVSTSYQMLRTAVGRESPQEEGENASPPSPE